MAVKLASRTALVRGGEYSQLLAGTACVGVGLLEATWRPAPAPFWVIFLEAVEHSKSRR